MNFPDGFGVGVGVLVGGGATVGACVIDETVGVGMAAVGVMVTETVMLAVVGVGGVLAEPAEVGVMLRAIVPVSTTVVGMSARLFDWR